MNKKNPQDATKRNVQAANKKIAALTARVRALETEQKRQAKVLKSHTKMFNEGKWA